MNEVRLEVRKERKGKKKNNGKNRPSATIVWRAWIFEFHLLGSALVVDYGPPEATYGDTFRVCCKGQIRQTRQ